MVDTIERGKCTGCKMCADICPQKAVYFETDQEGFWYPKVDHDKCIKCGLCEQKCPALDFVPLAGNRMPEVHAVWSKNDDVRMSSTSGGVFWEVAKSLIDSGGVVAGSIYGKDWKSAKHVIVTDIEGLLKVKGSKYFQSDTAEIYMKVKKNLIEGKKVLFCGTPCQNAALVNYLGKGYDNLYCMDFICRSINSPKAFKAYITELETVYGSSAVEVHLKDKKTGWESLATYVRFANGKEFRRDRNEDVWIKGFIENDLYTRDSCFECKYKQIPRTVADMTIGDFWGITGQSTDDMFKGISVVLLNSDKGKELFERTRDRFVVQDHTLAEVYAGNMALEKNPVKNREKDNFFRLLNTYPFSYCVCKCTKKGWVLRMEKIFRRMDKGLKRSCRIVCDRKISMFKFVYFNFLSPNVIRSDGGWILPYKGSILDLHPSARIYIARGVLKIGYNRMKGSKEETRIRMGKDAVWKCDRGAELYYDTTVEVKENAVLTTGFFTMNSGSVINTHISMTFGDDVMLGRNNILYDSDFHALQFPDGRIANPPQPVLIEDHVWLTTGVIVRKGVTIGAGSVIPAYSVVCEDIPKSSTIQTEKLRTKKMGRIFWDRRPCK